MRSRRDLARVRRGSVAFTVVTDQGAVRARARAAGARRRGHALGHARRGRVHRPRRQLVRAPATVRCTGAARSPSSAAATRPSKRACSSPSSPTRCTCSIGARSCAARPSPRSAPSPTPRCPSCGTRVPRASTATSRQRHRVRGRQDTGEMATLPVDGVFIFVGQVPNTAFLKGVVDLDEERLHRHRRTAAHVARGRVRRRRRPRHPLKQIAWAVGEGALAARADRPVPRYTVTGRHPAAVVRARVPRSATSRGGARGRSLARQLRSRRCSRRPARSWSTSGPSGADPAAWSAPSWRSWPASIPTSGS